MENPLRRGLNGWTGMGLGMIFGSYLWLGRGSDLRLLIPELIFFSAVLIGCLTLICYQHQHGAPRQRRSGGWLVAGLLLVAVLVRGLFVLRAPELSDDLFRYVWDGLQLMQGRNPYVAAPQGLIPHTSRELAVHGAINHPELVTIYPPMAQLWFALSAGSVIGMKVLCVVLDLGSCLVLAALLKQLQRSPWWLILYAWHPLVVLESAASAHIDVAALFLLLCSLWMLGSAWRWAAPASGLLLGLAVMTKLFPLLFAPFFVLAVPAAQRRSFVAALLLSVPLVAIPFGAPLLNGIDTLRLYVQNWEFSGFSFRLLRTLFNSGSQARLLVLTLFCCIVASQWWALRQTAVTLARLVTSCRALLLAFLLLTPTLHPWYALYLVAFIPLAPSAPAIVLSWSILLSYQVVGSYHLNGVWHESSVISFYIWLAPVSALLLRAVFFLRRKRARQA